MQPVAVVQPLVIIGGGLPLAVAITLHQVFDNGAGFSNDGVAVGDDRGLAQRMNLAQFGRGQHGLRVAGVMLDLVVQSQFLQQPDDTQGTGVFQVMHSNHKKLSVMSQHMLSM